LSNLISKKICIIRLSAIGDTCHTLSVIRQIQDNWPKTKITWIIGKIEAQLMSDIPNIEFIIFDKNKGFKAYQDIYKHLSNKDFDIALCMHPSMRVNFLYPMIQAPIKIGFDRRRAKDLQWIFTNRYIKAKNNEHALDALLSFASNIGLITKPLRWEIPLNKDENKFAAKFVDPNKFTVLISPCSSNRKKNFRNWNIKNYIRVIRYLSKNGCKVILTGGSTRLEAKYALELSANTESTNLIGKTSLKQLAALIQAADLVICPDSGPAHIATAFNTPVIGLYATSNPKRTGPYNSYELTINRYPDAVKKYLKKTVNQIRWGQRVRHRDAMMLITVEDVIKKIKFFLNSKK
tara:strand:+ start:1034 stop:2080 length:1047 start_codon:yes stop_codon:yes gene_type:complete